MDRTLKDATGNAGPGHAGPGHAGPGHAGPVAGLVAGLIVALSGCHSLTAGCDAVPASRLDRHLFGECRENLCPVPFSALGQQKPADHRIGPGDTLAIYVFGVLPASTDETPVLQRFQTVNQRYYPPRGSIVAPTAGLPISVDGSGEVDLPIIGSISLEGLTIGEARDKIKTEYADTDVVKEGRERVTVALITPRVKRVLVIREDTPNADVELVSPGQVEHIHRGSGEVIDLPAYENDVLHALASTGGLPGTDAARELWVFRQDGVFNPTTFCPPACGTMLASYHEGTSAGQVVKIPLAGPEGCPLPFTAADVVLEDGDTVFVPRREEYFYTGGLLAGAQIPLPRDRDIDVLEAIALATGSAGGPLAQSGQALASGNPGYVIKPTRVIILRELPDGRQLPIRVDLDRAKTDVKERIFIQPNDVVMLNFKPGQGTVNTLFNWLNFSVIFNGSQRM